MPPQALKIGELAQETGLAPSALRYYEEAGLLEPATRTEAGYRLFDSEVVGRVRFVQRAKHLGLSLDEIRQLLQAPRLGVEDERRYLRHMVAHKLAATRQRIVDLEALRSELEALYVRLLRTPEVGCGHLGDCECWLPTDEETITMRSEVAEAEASACTCCGCPFPGCPCGCPCCGRSGLGDA
jgi:DNA-binding transcriptional MerR regulator